MLEKIVLNLLWTPNDLDPLPVWNIELAMLHFGSTNWFQMSCYCHAKLNSWIVIKNMLVKDTFLKVHKTALLIENFVFHISFFIRLS